MFFDLSIVIRGCPRFVPFWAVFLCVSFFFFSIEKTYAQSCVANPDEFYDFDAPPTGPYRGFSNPNGSTTSGWFDNFSFSAPIQIQRSPDYVQPPEDTNNMAAAPRSTDANDGFVVMFAGTNVGNSDGIYIVYDFTTEPDLQAGDPVTITADVAPGYWHSPGIGEARANTALSIYTGDADIYSGPPSDGANPFTVNSFPVGAYQGVDDGDPDTWPNMPEANTDNPGTSWQTVSFTTNLPASRRLYVGVTGSEPVNPRGAIFFDALEVDFTSQVSDIALTGTGATGPLTPGDTALYSYTIENQGHINENPVVYINIPDGLTVAGATQPFANGAWSVGVLAPGETRTIDLTTIVDAVGPYGSMITAEISSEDASGAPSNDCDSSPGNSTEGEDDFVEFTVMVASQFISGLIFSDNGISSGTAHNGLQNGDEAGLSGITITATDDITGNIYGSAQTNGDGAWILAVTPEMEGAPVRLTVTQGSNQLVISEAIPAGLPAVVNNTSPDGQVVFTPAADVSYTDINLGLVDTPTLLNDQQISMASNQTRFIPHTYLATSGIDVTFAVLNEVHSLSGVFSVDLYEDANCDTAIDAGSSLLVAPISVTATQEVCLLVRIVTTASAPIGAILTYNLQAKANFTGTPISHVTENTDMITVSALGDMMLEKQVCNLSINMCDPLTGADFTIGNTALPGEVLRYRIVFTATGAAPVENILITDTIPDFTTLDSAAVTPRAPDGVLCNVTIPSGGGISGYMGPLEWLCTGMMSSGDEGIVSFDVLVDQ